VLKLSGRFALYDVVLKDGDPHYPVPWARTPATSFLLTAAATGEMIEAAGFRTLAWQDDTEAANSTLACSFSGKSPIGLPVCGSCSVVGP
jgi:sarcosine/dimethylglycine N-methyltransferase